MLERRIFSFSLSSAASSSFNFDSQTIAYYDATFLPLHNRQDELRLRFKTNYPNGLLFYAKGTQNNDFLSVELRNGSIYVGVDLGSMPERPGATIIQAGSVLDDYQWHDLAITRYLKNISVKIDQSVVHDESQSAFNGLDLDGKVSPVNCSARFFIDDCYRSTFAFSCLTRRESSHVQ